jgi:hypothetical protein
MLALTLLFERIVAHDVAPCAFAIADDNGSGSLPELTC